MVCSRRLRGLIFALFGVRRTERAIAPGTEPVLDSAAMCASAYQLFATRCGLPLPGSLALLLRR